MCTKLYNFQKGAGGYPSLAEFTCLRESLTGTARRLSFFDLCKVGFADTFFHLNCNVSNFCQHIQDIPHFFYNLLFP